MNSLAAKFLRPALNASLWLVWLLTIACTFVILLNYEMSPAKESKSPPNWPVQSAIARDYSRPNLIMFVHPKCPCSNASITELSRIMDKKRNLRATVVFVKPLGVESHWEKTELMRRASSMPNVVVFVDENLIEAHNFEAHTSGETLLYDETGHLLYSGGITVARGHEGDNIGEDRLLKLLEQRKNISSISSPAYGCQFADDTLPNRGLLSKCLR